MTEAEAMQPPYWWCLDHNRVEGSNGCANTVRLGPYDSVAEAQNALQRARERSEAWDHDPAWSDDPAAG